MSKLPWLEVVREVWNDTWLITRAYWYLIKSSFQLFQQQDSLILAMEYFHDGFGRRMLHVGSGWLEAEVSKGLRWMSPRTIGINIHQSIDFFVRFFPCFFHHVLNSASLQAARVAHVLHQGLFLNSHWAKWPTKTLVLKRRWLFHYSLRFVYHKRFNIENNIHLFLTFCPPNSSHTRLHFFRSFVRVWVLSCIYGWIWRLCSHSRLVDLSNLWTVDLMF